MRSKLLILLLLFSSAIQAATYYVSSVGNTTNSGLTTSLTWNLAKVNSFTFSAGDEILFKSGDTFYGSITLSESGSIGNPIKVSAYGSGAKPVITGFTTVTSWTNLGGNIWESTSTVSTLATCGMVTINGVNTEKGRYPNNTGNELGYLYYQSHTATSITSSSLDGVINWTGATVVLRPNAWAIATAVITSQSGGTLNYSSLSSSIPVDGYGFFINDDLRTLDIQNEWYYNPTTHKIRIYSASQPSNVNVSAVENVVYIQGNYITVENLQVTGADSRCIWAYKAMNDGVLPHHVIIQDCNTSFAGWYGIDYRGNYNTVQNCVVDESNWSGINGSRSGIGDILNNTVTNTSRFLMLNAGAGILCSYGVHSIRAEGNRVINTGENGLYIGGDSIIFVKNNYVDTFCTMTHDAAGIYCASVGDSNNVITGNIIINGIGNSFGTPNPTPRDAHGIYLDEGVQDVEVDHNSIYSNTGAGIFLHASANNNIHDNTAFDCFYQILFSSKSGSLLITGNTTTNNKFIAKTASQDVFRAVSYSLVTNPITNFGTFNNNYYARPIDDTDGFYIQTSSSFSTIDSLTLAEWQAYSGQDANSLKSPRSITNVNNLKFYYNDTNVDKVIFVTQPSIDVVGTPYVGNVTLEPFTSLVLIENAAYYLSSTGNDSNDGLSELTPWKTLDKVNSTTFSAGDNILFKRGDTFYGSLTIDQSGSVGTLIIFGAYGTGNNPIITGFTTVSAWTNLGSNIWESTSAASTLPTCSMVSINGVNTAMGRYPNADLSNGGFLTIASQPTSTSLTCSALTGIPNWSGAEIVIRDNDWTFSKRTVTSQTGSTVNYNSDCGAPTNYGFFFQNDIRTLDQQNEWYYNPTTKKISIYSTSQPVNVKIATVEDVVTIASAVGYLSIDGIDIMGANSRGIFRWVYGTEGERVHDVAVKNCNFSYSGMSAIAVRADNIIIENCTFNQSNTSAVDLHYSKGVQIKNNTIQNTGLFAGMGVGFSTIEVGGSTDTALIEYNTIINSGHNPITFGDDVSTIRYNFIDNYDTVLDDGGGIYGGSNATITHNIVLNGVGAWKGSARTSGGTAVGIYLDDNSINNTVSNNSVYNASSIGIFLHNARNNTIEDNVGFGDYEQISIKDDNISSELCTNNIVRRNIFVTKSATTVVADYYSVSDDLLTNGTVLDSNYYARPMDDNITFRDYQPAYGNNFKTLAQWKAYSGQDANSKKSPQAVTSVNHLQFEYNETSTAKIVYPNWASIDVTGKEYRAPVVLQPFASLILIKDYTPPYFIPYGLNGKFYKF